MVQSLTMAAAEIHTTLVTLYSYNINIINNNNIYIYRESTDQI